jgi:hypothetical protein
LVVGQVAWKAFEEVDAMAERRVPSSVDEMVFSVVVS